MLISKEVRSLKFALRNNPMEVLTRRPRGDFRALADLKVLWRFIATQFVPLSSWNQKRNAHTESLIPVLPIITYKTPRL